MSLLDLDVLFNGDWKLPYYLEDDYLKERSKVAAPRKWYNVQEQDETDIYMVPEEPSALMSSCPKSTSTKRLKLDETESEVIRRFSWKLNK